MPLATGWRKSFGIPVGLRGVGAHPQAHGISGNANAGINGIRFISGLNLDVQNCVIFGFNNNGIDIALGNAGNVHILNTILWNDGNDGISVNSSALSQVAVDHTQISNSGHIGIEASTNSRVTVSNSSVYHSAADGISANSSAGQATVSHSDISYNQNGITATGGGSANSFDNQLAYNTNCSLNNSTNVMPGSLVSFGQNRYIGSLACGVITPVATN